MLFIVFRTYNRIDIVFHARLKMTESETSHVEEIFDCSSAETLDNVRNDAGTTKHQKADIRNCPHVNTIQLVQIANVDKQTKESSHHTSIDGSNGLNVNDSYSNAIPATQFKHPIMEDQLHPNETNQQNESQQAVNHGRNDECSQNSRANVNMNMIMKSVLEFAEHSQRIQLEACNSCENRKRQNFDEDMLWKMMKDNVQCREQLQHEKAKVDTLENDLSQSKEENTKLLKEKTELEQKFQISQDNVRLEQETKENLKEENESQAKKIAELEKQLQTSQNDVTKLEEGIKAKTEKITELEQAVASAEASGNRTMLSLCQLQLNYLQDRVHDFEARDSHILQSLMRLQFRQSPHTQTLGSQIPQHGLGVTNALHVQAEFAVQLD